MKIYLNGQLVEKEKAVVSVFDHGLLYGDGVFEGIRAYHGRVFQLREHLDRLFNSARAIMLDIAMSKKAIEEAVLATLRANKLKDAYIRLVVTRGEGDLGFGSAEMSETVHVYHHGQNRALSAGVLRKGPFGRDLLDPAEYSRSA